MTHMHTLALTVDIVTTSGAEIEQPVPLVPNGFAKLNKLLVYVVEKCRASSPSCIELVLRDEGS